MTREMPVRYWKNLPEAALISLALFSSLLLTYFLISWVPTLLARTGISPQHAVMGAVVLNFAGIVGSFCISRLTEGRRRTPLVLGGSYVIASAAVSLTALTAGKFGPMLAALFASYSAAGFLSDAVNGLLPTDAIVNLIGLKVLIALEVLIPISLYISVVLAFGRLYSDSEFTAMFALRVTPARVMSAVLILSGCVAILVGGLSLFARPWAYQRSHAISGRAAEILNVGAMEAIAARDRPEDGAQSQFGGRVARRHRPHDGGAVHCAATSGRVSTSGSSRWRASQRTTGTATPSPTR